MKICYFGIYKSDLSRNRIYIAGLRARGIEVAECRDDGGKLAKYWNLWRKHRALGGSYDAMIVGYPGHLMTPFAKLISRKPVVADLLGSFKDAEEHSHQAGLIRGWRNGLIDRLAVWCADAILLESKAQKDFFIRKFGVSDKYKVLYTGLDETVFYCPDSVSKKKIALFRGRLTPESGIFHILDAAEILKAIRTDITIRIIGFHYRLGEKVKEIIKQKNLTNVELYYEYLDDDVLRAKMCETSVALGQFESSPRLDRTIPHKIFEAMRMGLPVVTASSPAVGELLEDGESCLFVKRADPKDLAEKIALVLDDSVLATKLSVNARRVYDERVSTDSLMSELLAIINKLK